MVLLKIPTLEPSWLGKGKQEVRVDLVVLPLDPQPGPLLDDCTLRQLLIGVRANEHAARGSQSL